MPALPPARRIAAAAVLTLGLIGAVLAWRAHGGDPRLALAKAMTALAQARYAEARLHYAAASNGLAGDAAVGLAQVAIEEEDGPAAQAQLQRAAAAGVPAAALATLRVAADLLGDDGDEDGADPAAVPASDTSPFAARVRARALAASGDGSAAMRLLGDRLRQHPGEAGAWVDLGRLQFGRGDLATAGATAQRALAIDPAAPAALTLEGDIVASRYGPAAALPWYAAALARDPDYLPALLPQAAALGEVGQAGAALAAARRAQAIRPAARPPRYLMAVLAARAGRTALARRLLQATDEAADAVPGALMLNGWLAEAAGQDDLAIAKWQQLLGDQPLDVALRRGAAAALLRSGDIPGAIDTLAPLLGRADADSETLEMGARAARRLGDPRWAALHDRAIAGVRGVSVAFAGNGGVPALTLAAAGGDPASAVALIRGLIDAGRSADAVNRAAALAARAPGAAAAQTALGDALVAAGRIGDAAAVYARAADLRFDEAAMLRLADSLARSGRPADAARTVALFLSQHPRNLVARRLVGHWLAAAGDARARGVLEGLRRDAGDRDGALLADLALAWRPVDLPRARVYAAAAYRLAPMNRGVIRLYAAILDQAGERDGARQLRAKDRALSNR